MPKDLTQLFQESTIIVPEGLSHEIFLAVEKTAKRAAQKQQLLWGAFSLASLGLFVASGFYAASSASTSGFSSYFSILFSDTAVAKTLWKEIGLSLLESLPVLGITVVLASTSAMLWTLRKFSKHTGRFSITSRALSAA